jgi:hypothetical protein
MAKHLGKSVDEIIADYCEFYEGANSKIPVVRIASIEEVAANA